MANVDRGEVDVELGGEVRTLTFRSLEVMLLEKRLKTDPLMFIAGGGGSTEFLIESVFAGLSTSGLAKKLNPARIAKWFDAFEGDRTKMTQDILYAIARGKPGEDGKEMARVLDDMFNGGGDGKAGPTSAA